MCAWLRPARSRALRHAAPPALVGTALYAPFLLWVALRDSARPQHERLVSSYDFFRRPGEPWRAALPALRGQLLKLLAIQWVVPLACALSVAAVGRAWAALGLARSAQLQGSGLAWLATALGQLAIVAIKVVLLLNTAKTSLSRSWPASCYLELFEVRGDGPSSSPSSSAA